MHMVLHVCIEMRGREREEGYIHMHVLSRLGEESKGGREGERKNVTYCVSCSKE